MNTLDSYHEWNSWISTRLVSSRPETRAVGGGATSTSRGSENGPFEVRGTIAAVKNQMSKNEVCEHDRLDPIAGYRDRFMIPEGTIYLDGNSLGPPPKTATARIEEVLLREWGRGLVRSWNDAGWIDLPERVAGKDSPSYRRGAPTRSWSPTRSRSISSSCCPLALRLRPQRRVILSDVENFGTDLYVAQGLVEHLGGDTGLRSR